MAIKTQPTKASARKYIDAISDPQRKADCKVIAKLMSEISSQKPVMWGTEIVGFGSYDYVYASGHSGTWPKIGFSSRKGAISIYLTCDLNTVKELLKNLGTHKRGVGCLYVKRLSDIDLEILKKMISATYTTN